MRISQHSEQLVMETLLALLQLNVQNITHTGFFNKCCTGGCCVHELSVVFLSGISATTRE